MPLLRVSPDGMPSARRYRDASSDVLIRLNMVRELGSTRFRGGTPEDCVLAATTEVLERLMLKNLLSLALCTLALIFATPAPAQTQPVRVGGLTCDTGPRIGLLVGSRQRMACVFRSNTGREYRYRGRITRLGIDVGVTGGGRLFWAVFAPTTHIGPGALRGTYVGAGGSASVGFGLGANVLVGGSNRTISLQPLSIEGQFGINLALGVAGLRLY
jgi:uncharacterized protein DUF992